MSLDTVDTPTGSTGRHPDPGPATPPEGPRRRAPWRGWVAVAVALAVLVLGGRAVATSWGGDIRSGTEAVSASEFAAHTGVRVDLVAVVGGGGMVELRYQVVDADKASLLIHQDDARPKMVAEDTGAQVVLPSQPHNHKTDFKVGGTYFIMFPNTRTALHDGTPVTLVVGDYRLEHLVARA